jgi:antitoxin component YwqK of YwqJK toxin-antitoxin module
MTQETKRVPASELTYMRDGLHHLDGQPFTGIAFNLTKDGSLKSELAYRDGLLCGRTREWYATGQPMVDSTYYRGALHGRASEWHRNGQLAEDGEYEYGITLWEKTWDEHGNVTRDVVLQESDPAYQMLLNFRRIYGGDPAA